MIKINITITKDTLQELRGYKDVWSEVVFRDGYELAPTYTLADIRCIEHLVAIQPRPTGIVGWKVDGRACTESTSVPFVRRPSTSKAVGGLAWNIASGMALAA